MRAVTVFGWLTCVVAALLLVRRGRDIIYGISRIHTRPSQHDRPSISPYAPAAPYTRPIFASCCDFASFGPWIRSGTRSCLTRQGYAYGIRVMPYHVIFLGRWYRRDEGDAEAWEAAILEMEDHAVHKIDGARADLDWTYVIVEATPSTRWPDVAQAIEIVRKPQNAPPRIGFAVRVPHRRGFRYLIARVSDTSTELRDTQLVCDFGQRIVDGEPTATVTIGERTWDVPFAPDVQPEAILDALVWREIDAWIETLPAGIDRALLAFGEDGGVVRWQAVISLLDLLTAHDIRKVQLLEANIDLELEPPVPDPLDEPWIGREPPPGRGALPLTLGALALAAVVALVPMRRWR